MKNLICALGILLPLGALAQWSIDLYSGANATRIRHHDLTLNYTHRFRTLTGYQAGIVPSLALNHKWELALPVQYASRGYRSFKVDVGPSTLDNAERISGLDLMLSAGYRLTPALTLSAGGFSFWMIQHRFLKNQEWETYPRFVRSGYNGGFMVELRSTHHRLTAYVRYLHGISKVDSAYPVPGNEEMIPGALYMRNVQFGAGYSLIKRKAKG